MQIPLKSEVYSGQTKARSHIPHSCQPMFVHNDWGSGPMMNELEKFGVDYFLTLKPLSNIKKLIYKHYCQGEWQPLHDQSEVKESTLWTCQIYLIFGILIKNSVP